MAALNPSGIGGGAGEPTWVVLPGLNLHPEALSPLEAMLAEQGGRIWRALPQGWPLRPEHGPPGTVQAVGMEGWLRALDTAHGAWCPEPSAAPPTSTLQPASRPPAAPANAAQAKEGLALLGHSLGAIAGLLWAHTRGIPLRRMVWVAPALGARQPLAMLLQLARLFPGSLPIPSLNAPQWRLAPWLPCAAYHALMRCMAATGRMRPEWEPALPPLFILWREGDEMISTRAIEDLARAQPGRVATHPLPGGALGHALHLPPTPETVGDAAWSGLHEALTRWLCAAPPENHPGSP